jgi:hypothetical protein
MASVMPKMKQKGAERHIVNVLGENHPVHLSCFDFSSHLPG